MTTPGHALHNVVQGALDGLARPLAQTDFVVVDLETTGGSPGDAAITEIGAVRTSGRPPGEAAAARGRSPLGQHGTSPGPGGAPCPDDGRPVLGGVPGPGGGPPGYEFATLVNPGRAIPPHVTALTGIGDGLVAAAPGIGEVLPRFIEFAAGSVLVAHNAPFDIGFLATACAQQQLAWPALPTLDTAALARRVLTTDEVRDCRLSTLARFFRVATPPCHRALDDARATAGVLHGLLRRLAERGVHTFEALRSFGEQAAPKQRRMSQLTAALPHTPGVCLFTAADGQVLHVVKSSDMNARACGYFAAAETRPHIRQMIDKTVRVLPVSCATTLEAEVAQIRLVAAHRPPYSEPAPARQEQVPGQATVPLAQIEPLAATPRVVAARPRFRGGWDVAWITYGLLTATATLPVAAPPPADWTAGMPVPRDTARRAPATLGTDAGRDAETACLLGWLMSPGTRLIEVSGTWCAPVPR